LIRGNECRRQEADAVRLASRLRLSIVIFSGIYYPGFTIGGISEPIAIILTIIPLLLTLFGATAFWLTLVALLGLLAQQIVFWFVTHPVNQFWVEGQKLNRLSAGFFSFGRKTAHAADAARPDWKELRDRWEYSHVVCAALALTSVVALVIVLSLRS